ncbi:anti-sigma factor [Candidatus Woesearchaeota archaeon]|nr:MAG: anti-sigma factor [Candidatus Woesearchaeota archaeon]
MKKFFALLAFAILALPAFAALSDDYVSPFKFPKRQGVERVTHYDARINAQQVDTFVYLEAAYDFDALYSSGRGGYAPIFPRGTARVKSSVWNGATESYVLLKTKDLPPSARVGGLFEAWLVDDDTGYRLSMGTFITTFGGSGELSYHINRYLGPYDRIEVTIEPFNDLDLTPGPPVISGDIPKSKWFTPHAKSSKLAKGPFESIN